VAKGEAVWGMETRQGTTLYLCLEDSTIRIQNRLFDITEDAPDCVHFSTDAHIIGQGLEEQVETFLAEHPDTVLIIIDTLQMIRRAVFDTSYANDYHELSVLKKLADEHGIAILLIHHLRKENDNDTFNRISGTTALQGAVDSSFTLVEKQRGSGKATLSCVGRDIEYRELELMRNSENIWEVLSDSAIAPELLKDNIIFLISDFMKDKMEVTATPTELAKIISANSADNISPKILSKRLLQNSAELAETGITFEIRRSNGKRLINLRRKSDNSDGKKGSGSAPPNNDPVDTDGCGSMCPPVAPCVGF